MASAARSTLGRRLGVLVACVVVATTLTVATAAASPPTPMGDQAPATTRPGASPDQDPGASTLPRGFLLDRGRFRTFTVPGAQVTLARKLNDRGQIVGVAGNP